MAPETPLVVIDVDEGFEFPSMRPGQDGPGNRV